MQLANSNGYDGDSPALIRPVRPNDGPSVSRLMQAAELLHAHVDWRPPDEWLGKPGFFVAEEAAGGRLAGGLVVTPDPLPAAWARLAILLTRDFDLFAGLFDAVVAALDPAIEEINWFLAPPWPAAWLARLGFSQVSAVESFVKLDKAYPAVAAVAGLAIRPARPDDLARLVAIEAAAFEPRWRHSIDALQIAWQNSFSFDVAELDGRVVGFQMSHSGWGKVHLSRMTVDPAHQGHGIGAALLAHALEGYYRRGLNIVSLNTQTDNVVSHRLYGRFGFRPVDDLANPVWVWRVEKRA